MWMILLLKLVTDGDSPYISGFRSIKWCFQSLKFKESSNLLENPITTSRKSIYNSNVYNANLFLKPKKLIGTNASMIAQSENGILVSLFDFWLSGDKMTHKWRLRIEVASRCKTLMSFAIFIKQDKLGERWFNGKLQEFWFRLAP